VTETAPCNEPRCAMLSNILLLIPAQALECALPWPSSTCPVQSCCHRWNACLPSTRRLA
jgi:hypothetical protein